MFRVPTLFIIGAGASSEVGLPTGDALKNIIVSNTNIKFDDFGTKQISGDTQITGALRQYVKGSNGQDGDINPFLHAAWAIRDNMPQAFSIDSYIDAHRDDEKITLCGKLAIVRSILQSEQNSKLYIKHSGDTLDFNKLQETWYSKFFKLLHDNVSKAELETIFRNISFINFNYDRTIEHYLPHALSIYYRIEENKAQDIVRKLKIFHPYGTVGQLPWHLSTQVEVPYGQSEYGMDLLSIAGQIKTFKEQVDDKTILDSIRSEVQRAKVIVFLGFGYHQQNLELIKPYGKTETESVFGTSKGLSIYDSNLIEKKISGITLLDRGSSVRINLSDVTCNELFEKFWKNLSVI